MPSCQPGSLSLPLFGLFDTSVPSHHRSFRKRSVLSRLYARLTAKEGTVSKTNAEQLLSKTLKNNAAEAYTADSAQEWANIRRYDSTRHSIMPHDQKHLSSTRRLAREKRESGRHPTGRGPLCLVKN